MQEDRLYVHGRLNCSFTDGPLPLLLSSIVTNFNYTIYGEKFRLSNVTFSSNWNLYLKVLNFDSFTDFGGSATTILTPRQMAGNDTIAFELQPARLEEKYKAGGRIRAEWKFIEQFDSPYGMANKVMYGSTIDVMDWSQQYPKKRSRVNTMILSVSLLAIFALFITGLFIYRYYKKKRQEAESRER